MIVSDMFLPGFWGTPSDPIVRRYLHPLFIQRWDLFHKLRDEMWNPNLSEIENRVRILNKWDELHGSKPLYRLLPNGELDVEFVESQLKKRKEKREKEREIYEAQLERNRRGIQRYLARHKGPDLDDPYPLFHLILRKYTEYSRLHNIRLNGKLNLLHRIKNK